MGGTGKGAAQKTWQYSAPRMSPSPSCPDSPGKSSHVGTPSVLALPTLNARSPSGDLWGQRPGLSGIPAWPPRMPNTFNTSTGSAVERSGGAGQLQQVRTLCEWLMFGDPVPTLCSWVRERERERVWGLHLLTTPQLFQPY